MINKNGRVLSRLGICLNVLLHYKKYEKLLGEQVRIIENNSNYKKYDKLIGRCGIIEDFEFYNFKNYLVIWIFDEEKNEYNLCFSPNEIELCNRR